MSEKNSIDNQLKLRLTRALEIVCHPTGAANASDLSKALEELDSLKDDPSLPAHLAHQLERRSYGKALGSLR